MSTGFSKNIYSGCIVRGDLRGAMDYVKKFPEQAERYQRYLAVFEREEYAVYEVDADLNELLTVYQRYYRDVFYLQADKEAAADRLRAGLAGLLGVEDENIALDELEENQVAGAFQSRGFYFLGGRTSGYYGPYVWRTTETKAYEVELPGGVQTYTVKLLDGFVSRSWVDYLSFGEAGTGGWSDGDGVINCVRPAYDLDSEAFQVSLLKHEAQHARDLNRSPNMSSEDLEYRAKLVELIYSSERKLLEKFAQEADRSDKSNGHAAAAGRIMEGFARKLRLDPAELGELPSGQVQAVAKALFEESNQWMN